MSVDPLVEALVSVEPPVEAELSVDPLEVEALVSVEALELVDPPVDVLVSTDPLVSVEPLVDPPVEVLVSTEALAEPLVPLEVLVSSEAPAEPPVPLEVLTSTEALGEPLVSTEAAVPLVTELASSAWAIPGSTPPSRPAVASTVRHRRTHRRRHCRPMRIKTRYRRTIYPDPAPSDLQERSGLVPSLSVACTPPGDSKTRSLGVVRNRKSRLEQWVKPTWTRTTGG